MFLWPEKKTLFLFGVFSGSRPPKGVRHRTLQDLGFRLGLGFRLSHVLEESERQNVVESEQEQQQEQEQEYRS
jgi:hypothetical protein